MLKNIRTVAWQKIKVSLRALRQAQDKTPRSNLCLNTEIASSLEPALSPVEGAPHIDSLVSPVPLFAQSFLPWSLEGGRRGFVVVVLLLFSITGCSTKELRTTEFQVAANIPNPAKPPDEFYTIGPGDVLEVAVWKEKNLSGTVTVRPDGYITLPLVNEIQVAGLTTEQLRKELDDKYKDFINSPTIMVRVEKIASSEIFLIGEVNRPGAYPVTGNDTILQLLTRAGGLTAFADRDSIRIVRRAGEKVTEYEVDYDAIVEGDLKQDILLRPGDRIIVP